MTAHRIGFDARLLSYREGGIAEYIRRLLEAFSQLDQENQYTVFQGRHAHLDQQATLTDSARNFHHVRAMTPCHHRLERWMLGLEVSRFHLDLLHSTDFIPPLFGASRTVISVHDLNFLYYPKFQTPDSARYYGGQIRAAVQKADHILVISEATKRDLCNLLNVAPEKITVQLLGVDPAFRPLLVEEVQITRKKFNLPSTYLLFVGTFEPRKNIAGLLDAYALLRNRHTDLPPLVLAGRRGWLYESIFDKVHDLSLEDRVIWLENVPFSDLPALYNGAAMLVLPSFYEGFGFPPLEALACGVLPIVSDRASLPEVVGPLGLLVDPDQPESIADAVYLALTDSSLADRARREGPGYTAQFTWERAARIALDVYRQTLES